MIEALTMPAILLALAISGGVIVVAQLLRALDLTPSPRSWGAQVAAILFGLAASTLTIAVANRLHRTLATTLDWIEDRVLRVRTARPQSAEAEALLREQLHERLQQDGTLPRTVINPTAGHWYDQQAMTVLVAILALIAVNVAMACWPSPKP